MKGKHILVFSLSVMVLAAVLSGSLYYMNQEVPELDEEGDVNFPVMNQDNPMFHAQENSSIISFDLGEMTLEDESNFIQIPLKGSLVVPQDEGEHPIVFIIPDVAVSDEIVSAYDELLAKIGSTNCLGIRLDFSELSAIDGYSVDMMKAVFDEYRQRLSESLVGESSDFGVELTNKGSLSKVVMIGHGASALNVFEIALDQEYKQQLNLAGALLINPVDTKDVSVAYPDVPTAIMLSHYNQDQDAIGQALYEDYRLEKARKSITTLVYAKDGNFDDFTSLDSEEVSSLSFERNVEFVSQYAVDFLQSIFDTAPLGSGFTVLEMTPKTLYGTEVRTGIIVPNTMMLINASLELDPTVNTLGGQIVAQDLKIETTPDGVPSFLLKWDSLDASLAIEIPNGHRDLSQYDAISLYLSNELSNAVMEDELIQNQVTSQSFMIELIDESNQSSRVVINSIEELLVLGTNEPLMYNERVMLNQFQDIDLKTIKQINLLFNQTASGSIRIADLSFVKSPK